MARTRRPPVASGGHLDRVEPERRRARSVHHRGEPTGPCMSDERTRGVPSTHRRRLIHAAGGSLVLALTPFEIARGATLLAVRAWPAEDYTRLTLEHDGPLRFSHFMVRDTSPVRLV